MQAPIVELLFLWAVDKLYACIPGGIEQLSSGYRVASS